MMCEPVAVAVTMAELPEMEDTVGAVTVRGWFTSLMSLLQAVAIIPMANSANSLDIYFIIRFI
jgi:hypothetical protein